MSLHVTRLMFAASLLLLSFAPTPAAADCLGQCESQHQTCLRGCTQANAKACVDSCFRGSSACRGRCRIELPVTSPKFSVAALSADIERWTERLPKRNPSATRYSFKGQCTKSSDCGVGWLCCNTSCEKVQKC